MKILLKDEYGIWHLKYNEWFVLYLLLYVYIKYEIQKSNHGESAIYGERSWAMGE